LKAMDLELAVMHEKMLERIEKFDIHSEIELSSEEKIVKAIVLASGVWQGVYFPAEVVKTVAEKLSKKVNIVLGHGETELGEKKVGEIIDYGYDSILEAVVAKIRITDAKAWELIKNGVIKGASIKAWLETDLDLEKGVRVVRDIDLLHVGLVSVPACKTCIISFRERKNVNIRRSEEKSEVKAMSEEKKIEKVEEQRPLLYYPALYPIYPVPTYPQPTEKYPAPYPYPIFTDLMQKIDELLKKLDAVLAKIGTTEVEEGKTVEMSEEKKEETQPQAQATATNETPAQTQPATTEQPSTQVEVKETPKTEEKKEEAPKVEEKKEEPKQETTATPTSPVSEEKKEEVKPVEEKKEETPKVEAPKVEEKKEEVKETVEKPTVETAVKYASAGEYLIAKYLKA